MDDRANRTHACGRSFRKSLDSFYLPAKILTAFGFLVLVFLFGCSRDPQPERVRPPQRPDPQAQLLDHYRQYPERYIRISDEMWVLNEFAHTAHHSFSLTNNAGVAYSEIEIRLSYQDSDGETLQSQIVKIQGTIGPYSTLEVKEMEARNVPGASESVLIAIAKATIHP